MKRCPTCARAASDHLTFCVDDGTALEATGVETLADLAAGAERVSLGRVLRLARALCATWAPLRANGWVPPAVSPMDVEVHEGDRVSVTFALEASLGGVGVNGLSSVTPFAAPETFLGFGAITEAAAVYHVAALVHCVLTGHVPFEGSSTAAIAVRKHFEAPPSPRALRPDVPAALDAAIVRALDRDPTRRFSSVAELAAVFEALTNESLSSCSLEACVGDETRRERGVSSIGKIAVSGGSMPVEACFCLNDGADLRTTGRSVDSGAVSSAPTTLTGMKPFCIGRYRCESRIGEGGMGVVYRARDVETGALRAVKVLFAQGQVEGSLVERFCKEARLAAAVRHPNCVAIYDHGEVTPRLLYLVMELLEGASLDAVLGGRAMAPLRVGAIVEQVCAALAAVHAVGIVHRDLKPHNVMLCEGDGVKLIDFGIARALDVTATTLAGRVVGTPAYMAPEQARAEADVDHRADVFSVGVMTWELLTGRLPFDPVGTALQQVARRAMLQEPVPPTGVSPHVDAVLARATEPERMRRTPDVCTFAREFLAALREETA